mgnify:CR=1 FL=1|jgi:hypothetical protein
MSDSSKQSPMGVNTLSGLLQNQGICINTITATYVGSSNSVGNYIYGNLISSTVLNNVTNAIRQGWVRYNAGDITLTTYNNLKAIGSTTIPALGNSPPSTYSGSETYNIPYTGQNSSYGYVRLFPWQAYIEFGTDYSAFLGSYQTAGSFITYSNNAIMTMQNSLKFLAGTYSNMNDLISGDITGVSLSTRVFGQDLIYLGKALDLTTISSFGLPSNLLATLRNVNALTPSLRIALLSTGLTIEEIDQCTANNNVTTHQQQLVYSAFLIIVGVDLADINISLNCRTPGLTSLADLLNPIKMFPNSYQTLTVPVYNANPGPTNSKTYYPIYSGSGLNSNLTTPVLATQTLPNGFGSRLFSILPQAVAVAADAFSRTMQQITNIKNIPIEKFAQVVSNMETTQGLTLVNTASIPTDSTQTNAALALIALGSGPFNTYTYSDFFGCMSGLPYQWITINTLINQIQSSALSTIYSNLYIATQGSDPGLDAAIQTQIDLANTEIASILSKNATQAVQLNQLWSSTATQLNIEQRARNNGLPANAVYGYPTTTYGFVDNAANYAKQTQPNMSAQTLEAISNPCNLTGLSLIGLLRETRNQARLSLVGIQMYNDIPEVLSNSLSSELIANGTLSQTNPESPGIPAYPNKPVDANDICNDNISGEYLTPEGYYDVQTTDYVIDGVAVNFGTPVVPGSLAGSPYVDLIPPELNTLYTSDVLLSSSPSIADAIENVITCNCDCWVN